MSKTPISNLQVKINGNIADGNSSLISTAVLKGVLSDAMEHVNLVNANLIATERGIKVSEITSKTADDFSNTVTVTAGENSVTGTLFGNEGRIVNINNFRVDVDPHSRILICPHINRPGVIGAIGTLLADYKINISSMQVGKTDIGGTNVMVLTLDNPISAEVIAKVKENEAIFDATLVAFD